MFDNSDSYDCAPERESKVNAGADIEKELAEKYGIDFADIRRTHIGSNVHTVTAALLAEAAERAKLEAELTWYKTHSIAFVPDDGRPIVNWRENADEARRLQTRAEQICADAELRASTEAERARGLEAQLETLRVYAQGIVDYDHAKHCSGEHHCANCINGRAALSQPPTPSAEPQRT